MTTKSASKLIDAAFAKFPSETREMVNTIRAIIHKAEPSIEEGWKWGPAFEKNGLVMGLWGFKKHVSFVFYRGSEMSDKHKLFNNGFDNAHNRMIKFTSMKEINEKKLIDYVKEAVKLNSSGRKKAETTELEIPEELKKWFAKNKKEKDFFDSIAHTFRKEMIHHIIKAKQAETRKKRFGQVTKLLVARKKSLN
ncbi:MAG TPA: DUF1801 domain-containing protein [Bacteroidia bacterium]|nr:DUF1801 domain-containing protein [Bacteroidia bacterium]